MSGEGLVRETAVVAKRVALGQFFTPLAVVEFMYQMALTLIPERKGGGLRLIDPACGEGVFLRYALDHKVAQADRAFGIDIDPHVRSRWEELGLTGKARLYCQNGLLDTPDRKVVTAHELEVHHRFDLVIGNPPFGGVGVKELEADHELKQAIRHFALWQGGEQQGRFFLSAEDVSRVEKMPIEVLFVERFVQLARPGGIVAIILPDGILANQQLQYVREWLFQRVQLRAVVSLPRETFKMAGTSAKTSIVLMEKMEPGKSPDPKKDVFMASAYGVGLNASELNDLPEVLAEFKKFVRGKPVRWGHNSPMMTRVNCREAFKAGRLNADYWDPKYREIEKTIRRRWSVKSLGEMIGPDGLILGDHARKSRGEKLGTGFPYKYFDAVGFLETGYDTTRIETCNRKTFARLGRTEVQRGDLLVACSGVGAVGRVCYIHFDPGHSCTGAVFTIRNVHLSPRYLTVFLKGRYGRTQIERSRLSVGTANIRGADVRGWLIPVLPEPIQQAIDQEFEEVMRLHEQAMQVKSQLRDRGRGADEVEQSELYLSALRQAETALNTLIRLVEEAIEGRRNALVR